jgi:hypothetical protein
MGAMIYPESGSEQPYLRTQPFPKKKAVGQAPHLPRGLTRGGRIYGLSTEINSAAGTGPATGHKAGSHAGACNIVF